MSQNSMMLTPIKVAQLFLLLGEDGAHTALSLANTQYAEVKKALSDANNDISEPVSVLSMLQFVPDSKAADYMLGWSTIVFAALTQREWNAGEYTTLLTTAFGIPRAEAERMAGVAEIQDDEALTTKILRYAKKAADLVLGGIYDENTTRADITLHGELMLLGEQLAKYMLVRHMQTAPYSLTRATSAETTSSEDGDPNWEPTPEDLARLRALTAVAAAETDEEGGFFSRAKKRAKRMAKKAAKTGLSMAKKHAMGVAGDALASAVPGGGVVRALASNKAVRRAVRRHIGDPSDPVAQQLAQEVVEAVTQVAGPEAAKLLVAPAASNHAYVLEAPLA